MKTEAETMKNNGFKTQRKFDEGTTNEFTLDDDPLTEQEKRTVDFLLESDLKFDLIRDHECPKQYNG